MRSLPGFVRLGLAVAFLYGALATVVRADSPKQPAGEIVPPAETRAALLTKAVAALRKVEFDERFPDRRYKQALLLAEAASLLAETDRPQAIALLKEADACVQEYKSVGKELVPIVFVLFRDAILDRKTDAELLEQLQQAVKKSPENQTAFPKILYLGGHIDPELTWKMIERASPLAQREVLLPNATEAVSPLVEREVLLPDVLEGISERHPPSAWAILKNLPEPTNTREQIDRGLLCLTPVLCARNLSIEKIPHHVKEPFAVLCEVCFVAAKKRGIGKSPDFSVFMLDRFAVAGIRIGYKKGKQAIADIDAADVVVPRPPDKSPWDRVWTNSYQAAQQQVRKAGRAALLESPNAEQEYQKALAQVRSLVELLKQQPPVEKGSFNAGYRLNLGDPAELLLMFSPELAERFLKDTEPLVDEPTVTVPPEIWLKLTRSNMDDPAKGSAFADKIDNPLVQAEAWLALARYAPRQ